MKGILRALVRSAVIAAIVAALTAAVRALVGRLSGEPGTSHRQRGSFDSWPVVPPAPERPRGDGSRVADDQ
jgi:hypothetical protein